MVLLFYSCMPMILIITGDDMQGIQDLKHFLGRQFEMKDLTPFNYFLGL